jgi:WD40 repeat protein
LAIGSPIAAYRINRERQRVEAEKLLARQNAYAADMSLALRDVNSGSLGRPQSLLATYRPQPGEPDLRRWEWRLLWKLCRSDAWFTLSRERADLATLAVSPDGQRLAVRELSGYVSLWDIPTRKKTAVLPGGSYLRALAFSPRGDLLASGHWQAAGQPGGALWDVAKTQLVVHLRHPDRVRSVVFSHDGTRLAAFGVDQGVRLWDLRNLPEPSVITNFPCLPTTSWLMGVVAISPDGATLAVGETDGRVRLIDLVTYQEKTNFVAGVGILALAFSPDGKILASGSGYIGTAIRLWDRSTGQPLGALEGHGACVSSVTFHPRDSKILASAGGDQTVRLWDLGSRQPLAVLQGHVNEIRTVAFVPDGWTLVSCDRNGDVLFWRAAAKPVWRAYQALPVRARMVAFFPDSRSFATAEGPVILWDSATLQERDRVPTLGTNNLGVVVSPDGQASDHGRFCRKAQSVGHHPTAGGHQPGGGNMARDTSAFHRRRALRVAGSRQQGRLAQRDGFRHGHLAKHHALAPHERRLGRRLVARRASPGNRDRRGNDQLPGDAQRPGREVLSEPSIRTEAGRFLSRRPIRPDGRRSVPPVVGCGHSHGDPAPPGPFAAG